MTAGYVYSFDGEHFEGAGWPTRTEAVEAGRLAMSADREKFKGGTRHTLHTGLVVPNDPKSWMPDMDDLVSDMQESAYGELGEFADGYLDGWSSGKTMDQLRQIDDDLVAALEGVFKKHNIDLSHHGYTVKDESTHEFAVIEGQ